MRFLRSYISRRRRTTHERIEYLQSSLTATASPVLGHLRARCRSSRRPGASSVASHEAIFRDRSSDGGLLGCAPPRDRAHHSTEAKDHRCPRADRQLECDFDGCGYAHERLGPKQHAGAANVLGSAPAPAFLANGPVTDGKVEREAPGTLRLVLQESSNGVRLTSSARISPYRRASGGYFRRRFSGSITSGSM